MPFADYLSSSVTLVCDSHADLDRCSVWLKCILAIAKDFEGGIASIAIVSEFFLGKCDGRFHS